MSDRWAYIARTPVATKRDAAGTVLAATVDTPDMAESNAKEIAKWIKAGMVIERVPVEWVRQFLFTTEPYKGTQP